jgi:hypothetical protein
MSVGTFTAQQGKVLKERKEKERKKERRNVHVLLMLFSGVLQHSTKQHQQDMNLG